MNLVPCDSSEVVLIVTATCLGLLVNILLVVGIHKNKRYKIHNTKGKNIY